MRTAYRVLALAICVLVAVQAMTVAFSTFGILNWVDNENDLTKSAIEADTWEWTGATGTVLHGQLGMMVIPIIALVLLIVSFLAKVPGGVKWAVIILVDVVVQVVIAIVAFSTPLVGALHGLNAFILFGLAMTAAQQARKAADVPATQPL